MFTNKLTTLTDDRTYPEGQIIIFQGAQIIETYVIKKGYVIVYDISPDGDRKVLMILKKGQMLPLIWSNKSRKIMRYFYEALTDVEVSVYRTKDIRTLAHEDLETATMLLDYYVKKIEVLTLRLHTIEGTSAKHKIAELFIYLKRACGRRLEPGKFMIRPELTQQLLAEMCGISRETVSINLKELTDTGAISIKNNRFVVNIKQLKAAIADAN